MGSSISRCFCCADGRSDKRSRFFARCFGVSKAETAGRSDSCFAGCCGGERGEAQAVGCFASCFCCKAEGKGARSESCLARCFCVEQGTQAQSGTQAYSGSQAKSASQVKSTAQVKSAAQAQSAQVHSGTNVQSGAQAQSSTQVQSGNCLTSCFCCAEQTSGARSESCLARCFCGCCAEQGTEAQSQNCLARCFCVDQGTEARSESCLARCFCGCCGEQSGDRRSRSCFARCIASCFCIDRSSDTCVARRFAGCIDDSSSSSSGKREFIRVREPAERAVGVGEGDGARGGTSGGDVTAVVGAGTGGVGEEGADATSGGEKSARAGEGEASDGVRAVGEESGGGGSARGEVGVVDAARADAAVEAGVKGSLGDSDIAGLDREVDGDRAVDTSDVARAAADVDRGSGNLDTAEAGGKEALLGEVQDEVKASEHVQAAQLGVASVDESVQDKTGGARGVEGSAQDIGGATVEESAQEKTVATEVTQVSAGSGDVGQAVAESGFDTVEGAREKTTTNTAQILSGAEVGQSVQELTLSSTDEGGEVRTTTDAAQVTEDFEESVQAVEGATAGAQEKTAADAGQVSSGSQRQSVQDVSLSSASAQDKATQATGATAAGLLLGGAAAGIALASAGGTKDRTETDAGPASVEDAAPAQAITFASSRLSSEEEGAENDTGVVPVQTVGRPEDAVQPVLITTATLAPTDGERETGRVVPTVTEDGAAQEVTLASVTAEDQDAQLRSEGLDLAEGVSEDVQPAQQVDSSLDAGREARTDLETEVQQVTFADVERTTSGAAPQVTSSEEATSALPDGVQGKTALATDVTQVASGIVAEELLNNPAEFDRTQVASAPPGQESAQGASLSVGSRGLERSQLSADGTKAADVTVDELDSERVGDVGDITSQVATVRDDAVRYTYQAATAADVLETVREDAVLPSDSTEVVTVLDEAERSEQIDTEVVSVLQGSTVHQSKFASQATAQATGVASSEFAQHSVTASRAEHSAQEEADLIKGAAPDNSRSVVKDSTVSSGAALVTGVVTEGAAPAGGDSLLQKKASEVTSQLPGEAGSSAQDQFTLRKEAEQVSLPSASLPSVEDKLGPAATSVLAAAGVVGAAGVAGAAGILGAVGGLNKTSRSDEDRQGTADDHARLGTKDQATTPAGNAVGKENSPSAGGILTATGTFGEAHQTTAKEETSLTTDSGKTATHVSEESLQSVQGSTSSTSAGVLAAGVPPDAPRASGEKEKSLTVEGGRSTVTFTQDSSLSVKNKASTKVSSLQAAGTSTEGGKRAVVEESSLATSGSKTEPRFAAVSPSSTQDSSGANTAGATTASSFLDYSSQGTTEKAQNASLLASGAQETSLVSDESLQSVQDDARTLLDGAQITSAATKHAQVASTGTEGALRSAEEQPALESGFSTTASSGLGDALLTREDKTRSSATVTQTTTIVAGELIKPSLQESEFSTLSTSEVSTTSTSHLVYQDSAERQSQVATSESSTRTGTTAMSTMDTSLIPMSIGTSAKVRLVSVIDAATLRVLVPGQDKEQIVRALAIDADEVDAYLKPATPWGKRAAEAAQQFFQGATECTIEFPGSVPLDDAFDLYRGHAGHPLVYAHLNRTDYQEFMIRNGYTPYYTKHGNAHFQEHHDRYSKAEIEAQLDGVGIWDQVGYDGSACRHYIMQKVGWLLRAAIVSEFRELKQTNGSINDACLDYQHIMHLAATGESATVFTEIRDISVAYGTIALATNGHEDRPFGLKIDDIHSDEGRRLVNLLQLRYMTTDKNMPPSRGYCYATGHLEMFRNAPYLVLVGPESISDSFIASTVQSRSAALEKDVDMPMTPVSTVEDVGSAEAIGGKTGVFIRALLPNPRGADRGHETVTLRNVGSERVSLRGWTLSDKHGRVEQLFGVAEGNGEVTITLKGDGVQMNNMGDTITLLDARGVQRHQVSYVGRDVSPGKVLVFNS